jgi:hypothetical protein
VGEKFNPMDVESVSMDSLKIDERNARKGNISAIVESLEEFGQHRPVVAHRKSKKIIAGNHMFRAAQALGWDKINVYWVDDDETTAIRRGLADNATGNLATWDEDLLADLLTETGAVPGIDEGMLQALTESVDKEVKEKPIFPITARVNEKYDYVIVVAKSEIDTVWMTEKFGLRVEQSYKGPKTARSHVVTVERLQELWKNS